MKKLFLMSIVACAFGVFTSCSSDEETTTTGGGETTVTTGFGAVEVQVATKSRAASSLLSTAVTNVTATSVTPVGDNFLVTYHGRTQDADSEQEDIAKGMLQIVDKNGAVLSELTTEKCRVNSAAADGKTVYIGLDRGATNKTAPEHCAIATITLTDNYTFDATMTEIPAEQVKGLEGVSVNNVSVKDGVVYLATSTGDVKGKTFEGGYYKIENGNLSAKGDGWSAYWYDGVVKVRRAEAHSSTCYATIYTSTANETKVEFTCTDKAAGDEQYGRVTASLLKVNNSDYLFTCGDDLIAWVYDSTSGKYVNMNAGDTREVEKDGVKTTEAAEFVSGSGTTSVATDGTYVYACIGNAVSKYYLREYKHQDKVRFEQALDSNKKVVKFTAPDSWTTDTGSLASANHLIVKDGVVYVAFGYKGFVALDAETLSLITPAE